MKNKINDWRVFEIFILHAIDLFAMYKDAKLSDIFAFFVEI